MVYYIDWFLYVKPSLYSRNKSHLDEVYNPFVIVDVGFQAGVNLQKYDTLIFAQMDIKGERLLEPVDIEQWIGRIHRTGQIKTCRIITILTTNMRGEDPDPAFLRWYYDILADAEGFDLYGNNTPDVAFVQPIVTDMLKKELKVTDNLSFSDLLKIVYSRKDEIIGDTPFGAMIIGKIEDICKMKVFGKQAKKDH